MKRKFTCALMGIVLLVTPLYPKRAKADLFGGDVVVLTQILANAVQQLLQLKNLLSSSRDTLGLIRDINTGIRNALNLIQTVNSTLKPGVFSDLRDISQIQRLLESLYGHIPRTAEARAQQNTDQTIAEAIQMHNQAFEYAQRVDPEAERIKQHAHSVSPQGAAKLTAQSIGVLIHVMNQVLRTNAALLKMQGAQLAITNKKEKLSSQQFKMQYEGLSDAFGELKGNYSLPSLKQNQ